ncbi:unnamed protein product [Aphanomyces euteiches]|uniref:VTT domain-containing protein n=1 Tax=Aphanomyces euteiches TaxID=100861 RepID=A0A6G0X1Y8_9STRA|nr:hypothetical protein Ae201684_009373 [Aphanomyces euteiches]KAH9156503.1 hypothetical protein AeRB84_001578 [Aphanomyces euteiches]
MPPSYRSIPVAADSEESKKTRLTKNSNGPSLVFFLLAGSFCLVAVVCLYEFTQTKAFANTVEWEQKHQIWGGLIFMIVYAVCIILCCPSTLFDLTAGYLFGFGFGNVVALGGKTFGSVVAFLIGRYVMKDTVRQKLQEGQPMFRAWALLLDRDQLQFVVLLQLAYIPIFIKNYGLAILHIPFGLFLWTSIFIGGARTVLTVYIGHSVTKMAHLFSGEATAADSKSHLVQEILIIVTVVSTLLLAIVGGYKTRQYIDELAKKELEQEELIRPSASH